MLRRMKALIVIFLLIHDRRITSSLALISEIAQSVAARCLLRLISACAWLMMALAWVDLVLTHCSLTVSWYLLGISLFLVLQWDGLLLSPKARIIVRCVYLLTVICLLEDLSILSNSMLLQSHELNVVLRLSALDGHLVLAHSMDEYPDPVSVLVSIGSQQLQEHAVFWISQCQFSDEVQNCKQIDR